MQRSLLFTILPFSLAFVVGCGGQGNPPPPPTITSVTVSPDNASLLVKATQQFTANVQGTGNFNSAVSWYVNNVQGGNSTVGTISANGFYTAPNAVPSPNSVTVLARSVQDGSKSDTSSATINPENVQISVSPPSVSLQLSGTQRFDVTVNGTVNQSFFWTINGAPTNTSTPWGTIDFTGLYTAPSLLPANPSVTLTATSLEDSSRSVSAVVTILATAAGITVTISPQNPSVVFDGSQSIQFTATVTGTSDTAVNWSVDTYGFGGTSVGNITSDGTFTPLGFNCTNVFPSGAVHAVSVANPGAQGVMTVNLVPPTPVITTLSPQPAAVETTLQLSGTFAQGAGLTLLFPGPNGTTIAGSAGTNTGTAIGGNVPMGASSGALTVLQQCSSTSSGFTYPASPSNSVNFERLPQLRIRADRKDLAAGESLQLRAAFLGDSTPLQITWGNGISASGVYTAPSQVAPDTFVTLSACIQNTIMCDSLVVRVNPVRIDPEIPSIPTGETLQLSAMSGGTTVAPNWSILAGGGNILSSGLFSAPTMLEDSGPVLVTASYGGFTAGASVGVTGAVPGLVNRVVDYPNNSILTGPFDGTRSLVVDSSRAYVLSASTLTAATQEYCRIDVYDLSDPIHPVWMDAAEALKSEVSPYECSGSLYAYGGFVYELIPNAETAQGLSTEVAQFKFTNNHLALQTVWSAPLAGAYFSFNPAYTFNQGVFYALPNSINPATSGGPISISVLDVRTGSLVQASFNLPLPQPGLPAEILTPSGTGNFIYVMTNQSLPPATPVFKLSAYDVSVSPPRLVGTVDTMVGAAPQASPGTPRIFGTILSDGWDVYDISGGLPNRLGAIPYRIDDFNSNRSLAIAGGAWGTILDVSSPGTARVKGILYDGLPVGFPFTWVGDLAYRNEGPGGLGIYSPVAAGGQIPLEPPPTLGVFGTIFDQLVNGNNLYVAQQGDFNGVVIYDLSSSPPVLLGSYSENGQHPFSLALAQNLLFVGTAESLLVLDITTQSAPTKVATLAFPTSAMAISGNLLYVGTTDNRLVVLNVSNPTAPVQVSQSALPDFPNILRTFGNLLFIADNTAGLLTYEISHPSTPVLVSQFTPSLATEDVAIDGSLALLAAADGGLVIADMSNPSAPTVIGQVRLDTLSCISNCPNQAAALSVAVRGGLVYVGSVGAVYGEVFGFDYRVPTHPRLVSLMSYGGALDEAVLNFAFYQSEMFVGGSLFAVADRRSDISQPRNTINLYYPGFPGGSGTLSSTAANHHPFTPAKMKSRTDKGNPKP